jgi:transposase
MSASNPPSSKHKSRHQYPPEMRERAVRMVLETIKETGERHGVVTRVGLELGIGSETLRHWVKKAEVDRGLRPGVSTADRQRIVDLEKENRELRRANEILKTASAFFARELDPRLPN